MRKWCALFSVVATLASSVVMAPSAMAQPVMQVRVAPVQRQTVEERRELTGELHTARRSRIAAQEPGLVLELLIEVGDRVATGDVLARLDDRLATIEVERWKADVLSKEANLRERESQLERAQREFKRITAFNQQTGAGQNELDDAKTSVDASEARRASAEAELGVARAALREAEVRLSDLTIRAPFDGAIVAKQLEVGEWVDKGNVVAEMVELRWLDAWIEIPEDIIHSVSGDDAIVQLSIGAVGKTLELPVTAVVADGDVVSHNYPVRIRLENTDDLLKPGMGLVARVPTGRPMEALTIPKDALLRDDAGSFVYFDAGGQAMPARVHTLFAVGDSIAIRAGQLREGMNVIIEGNERLYPTARIVIQNGSTSTGGDSRASASSAATGAMEENDR